MGVIRKLYKWIIISVMIQTAFLAYIDFVYLGIDGPVKATVYDVEKEKDISRKVKISEKAKEIKVSYNGSYAAFTVDSKLEILDVKNNKRKKTIDASNGYITYYRWLTDRNILIYSKTVSNMNGSCVEVITYDPELDVERSYPNISELPEFSEVVDIQFSTITNIVYVKVKLSESQAEIYKYNIMDELKYVTSTGINTVIKETIYRDSLVYQDDNSKIYVRDGEKNTIKALPFEGKMVLLGIDSKDRIFIGELSDENKIARIHYGGIDNYFEKELMSVQLDVPVTSDRIIISQNGVVYELMEGEKTLKEIKSGRHITFYGNFIEMLNNYIVTMDGKYLKITENTV